MESFDFTGKEKPKVDSLTPEKEAELAEIAKRENKASRREFLGNAAGFGLFASGIGAAFYGVEKSSQYQKKIEEEVKSRHYVDTKVEEEKVPTETIEDPKVYRSGERIKTPFGRVKVNGWKFTIPKLDFWGYKVNAISDGEGFTLSIKNSEGFSMGDVTSFDSIGDLDNDLTLPATGVKNDFDYTFIAVPGKKGPVVKMEINVFRDESKSLGFLNDRAMDAVTDRNVKSVKAKNSHKRYIYNIELPVSTVKPADATDKVRVLSEPGAPREELQRIHNLHRDFTRIQDIPPVFVFDAPKDPKRGGQNSMDDATYGANNFIHLNLEDFTNPKFKDHGELVSCHELTHGLVQNTSLSQAGLPVWNKLMDMHEKIRSGDLAPRNNPIFLLIREANYIQQAGKKSDAGHPWDNTDEFVASLVTTIRYFPGELIKRYHELPDKERKAAHEIVQAGITFLESVDKSTGHEVLKKIIPEYEKIKALR